MDRHATVDLTGTDELDLAWTVPQRPEAIDLSALAEGEGEEEEPVPPAVAAPAVCPFCLQRPGRPDTQGYCGRECSQRAHELGWRDGSPSPAAAPGNAQNDVGGASGGGGAPVDLTGTATAAAAAASSGGAEAPAEQDLMAEARMLSSVFPDLSAGSILGLLYAFAAHHEHPAAVVSSLLGERTGTGPSSLETLPKPSEAHTDLNLTGHLPLGGGEAVDLPATCLVWQHTD
jgi:hypothetical protein